MKKAGFAYWGSRIAPVFDVARQILVIEAKAGRIVIQREETLVDDLPAHKALRLAELGINILVCGAISRSLQALVAAYGIRVIPFMAGDLRQVIRAWLNGSRLRDAFAMPGCCGHLRRHFRSIQSIHQEVNVMNGRGRGMGGGGMQGGGRGQNRSGQKSGRSGSLSAAGFVGYCVCPQCGQKTSHRRGIPCVEQKCPKCGTVMIRG